MTNPEANKATYLRLVEAYNRHDIDTVVDCYARDGVHHEPFTTPPDFVGHDAIRRFNAELIASFPDEKVEPRRLFSDGDFVFAICHCTGTHTGEFLGMHPTQRRFAVDECAVLEFDDAARIKNFWVYVDSGSIARQLGFGFAPASSSESVEEEEPRASQQRNWGVPG